MWRIFAGLWISLAGGFCLQGLVSGQCSGSGIDSVDQRVALFAKRPDQ